MGSISPFGGARRRRNKRREKRRADRKLRKEGPEKQYYGGSEERYKELSGSAADRVTKSGEAYAGASEDLRSAAERADTQERIAGTQYQQKAAEESTSRQAQREAIGGLSAAGEQAIGTRNEALLRNDANVAAARGIQENEAVAAQRLALQQNMLTRRARGLAGSMGEGGALAMQAAIQGSNAGGADLAAQNAVTQSEQAAAMRQRAAEQQISNAMAVADANAGTTMGTAGAVVDATGQLRAADQARVAELGGRQANLLGLRGNLTQAGAGLALENQGQGLQNQQFVEGTQLGVDVQDAQNKALAAQNRGITGFLKRTAGAFNAGKSVLDSADYGPTKKLLGGQ